MYEGRKWPKHHRAAYKDSAWRVKYTCGTSIARPAGHVTGREALRLLGWSPAVKKRIYPHLYTATAWRRHFMYRGIHSHFVAFVAWPLLEFAKRVDMVGGYERQHSFIPAQEIAHCVGRESLGAWLFVLWALERNLRVLSRLMKKGGVDPAKYLAAADNLKAARVEVVDKVRFAAHVNGRQLAFNAEQAYLKRAHIIGFEPNLKNAPYAVLGPK